jgi:hypothetical protein
MNRRMFSLSNQQMANVMAAARDVPQEKRALYLERLAAMLKLQHRFNDQTLKEFSKLAARDKTRNGDLEIAGWRVLPFTGSQIWNHHKWCGDRVAKLAKNEIDAQLRRRGLIT